MSVSPAITDADPQIVGRGRFRNYFQPSRVVIGIVRSGDGFNPVTLCFTMHCSYKPPGIAVAIHDINESYELFDTAEEFVLAVPGPALVEETMYCGVVSSRDQDKLSETGLRLQSSTRVRTPSLADAIANIEVSSTSRMPHGDHLIVAGTVEAYTVNPRIDEPPLVSVAPASRGFRVLAQQGVHRLAVAT